MTGPRARRVAVGAGAAVVLIVLAAAAATGGYLTTDSARTPRAAPRTAAAATPAAYSDALSAPAADVHPVGAAASPAAVRAALGALVASPDLGGRLRADVIDASTGATDYARGATAPTAPASTAKLLTAAAILSIHQPTDTFVTRVVRGPGTAVTLVGAGDPTLSAAATGRPTQYAGAARVSALATLIRRSGIAPSRIVVDDSLFTGPSVSPAWAADDVPSSYASPITAAMVDGGRDAVGDTVRSTAPDLAAGRALAAALGRPSLTVTRGTAPAGAPVLARVRSAPIGTLVFQMLQDSDNVIAEVLGRQVALAQHLPASFTGAVAAIRSELVRLGVDPGTSLRDASGLAATDRLTPTVLTRLVRIAASTVRPQLRFVLSDLPVAGWSGTLADRYLQGTAAQAAGDVRAKTGTLTGVSTLVGLVHDRSNRLLVIALMADRTVSTPAADAALDLIAARIAACGCGP